MGKRRFTDEELKANRKESKRKYRAAHPYASWPKEWKDAKRASDKKSYLKNKIAYAQWSEERKLRHEQNRKERRTREDVRMQEREANRLAIAARRKANPEYFRKRQNEWRAKQRAANPEKVKEYKKRVMLKSKYGITLEAYNMMLVSQNHCCAICETATPGKRGWVVDHCHTTGLIRKILCNNCNMGLGLFKHDTGVLQKAVAYLDMTHPCDTTKVPPLNQIAPKTCGSALGGINSAIPVTPVAPVVPAVAPR